MCVAGCQLETLDHLACRNWLAFALGRGHAPRDLGEPAWLLCHCDDGVTWGRRDGGEWRLGSTFFPDLCPVPAEENLQEMRVFSPVAEVLVLRAENGLRGRVLRDVDPEGAALPDRPDDEERLLLIGRVVEHCEGFTRVRDGSGAEQVLPMRIDSRLSSWLRVRHYFVREEKTGGIRVMASRLVEVI